jgi:hypothetical protein
MKHISPLETAIAMRTNYWPGRTRMMVQQCHSLHRRQGRHPGQSPHCFL